MNFALQKYFSKKCTLNWSKKTGQAKYLDWNIYVFHYEKNNKIYSRKLLWALRYLNTCRKSMFSIKNILIYKEKSIEIVNNTKYRKIKPISKTLWAITWKRLKIIRQYCKKYILQKNISGTIISVTNTAKKLLNDMTIY